MGVTEDMREVTEKIVSSYQDRISTVAAIIDDTHQILEDFKTKRDEMSSQLKETLAKEEHLRKKDFDNTMEGIFSHQDKREKQVRDLLKTFFEEQKEIAQTLKKNLMGGEKVRVDEFKKSLKDIQVRQKARENEVTVRLREFQKEHKETAESLRSLLNKGEAIRIKDFKKMVKDIRVRQTERAKEVRTRLDEFRKERQDMASHWHNLTVAMAKKRDGSLKGGEGEEKGELTRVSNGVNSEQASFEKIKGGNRDGNS